MGMPALYKKYGRCEKQMQMKKVDEIAKMISREFPFSGRLTEIVPYGSGHINDTYRVTCQKEDHAVERYIIQRINTNIFKADELMENISGITEWMKKKIQADGGDPARETLNIVKTKDGAAYYQDEDGSCWRAYIFIERATSYNMVEKPDDFYQCGLAFGRFQQMLSDYPAGTLHEAIPDFHNTVKRFRDFKHAVEQDACGRRAAAAGEIRFVEEREEQAGVLCRMRESGELPVRVTHNDTKLNNIMIDDDTRKAICVIDLDTVMPGLAAYDYGDSIRFGASTALEDETDLSKVTCDMELFRLYTRGFLEGCAGRLTAKETEMLPMGAWMMTYECGMRFLADYLEGDVYFKIDYPSHNLDRARNQFKLVRDMEEKMGIMNQIVKGCM